MILKFRALFLNLLTLAALLGAPLAQAAEIIRATRVAVIVKFDPFEENFAVGDRLVARRDGKRYGLIEIRKIKGEKMLGRILAGTAAPGMTIQKNASITGGKEKTSDTVSETVTLKFMANYASRGIPFRRNHIQGTLDLINGNTFGGLIVMTSDAPSTSEADLFGGYTFNHVNYSITPYMYRYFFPGYSHYDTWDFCLNVASRIFSLELSYRPEAFGIKSSETYSQIISEFEFRPKWKINSHIAYSIFSNEALMKYKNYLSYKLGFIYYTNEFTVEFNYSDTNRQSTTAEKITDSNAGLVISKKF